MCAAAFSWLSLTCCQRTQHSALPWRLYLSSSSSSATAAAGYYKRAYFFFFFSWSSSCCTFGLFIRRHHFRSSSELLLLHVLPLYFSFKRRERERERDSLIYYNGVRLCIPARIAQRQPTVAQRSSRVPCRRVAYYWPFCCCCCCCWMNPYRPGCHWNVIPSRSPRSMASRVDWLLTSSAVVLWQKQTLSPRPDQTQASPRFVSSRLGTI